MGVVREVLGDSVADEVDDPIVSYIANALADQDFDFGPSDGHGNFDALGDLLIDARYVYDRPRAPPRGLVGRNGTGKTPLLRAMAHHAIDGIPKNCQILHVEQEVTGDDTTALQCALNADVERVQLMHEEAHLGQLLKDLENEAESKQSLDKSKGDVTKMLSARGLTRYTSDLNLLMQMQQKLVRHQSWRLSPTFFTYMPTKVTDTFERTRGSTSKNQLKAFETYEKARGHMQVLNFIHLIAESMPIKKITFKYVFNSSHWN
uniref:ABC transporter domain-containing protein n=1 Tax=Aegilops tauschii TaxID=37682 RepID=M8BD37_AEGTA